MSTDFLLENAIVVPCEGRREIFDPGSVLVLDGKIVACDKSELVASHPAAAGVERIDLGGHVVIPGLHNAHLHSGLLRGTAESLALWEWLEQHVDPAHRALTPEIAEAASWMAYTEGLRSGTTSVLDMWRFMEGSARAADEIGIRATLAPYSADKYSWFETMDTNRRLLETHRTAADGRVRAWIGLEHMFYCSPAMFHEAATMAEEFDVGIHTHSSETVWEVEESVRQYGKRPIEVFAERGILDGRAVIAHGVWLDQTEIDVCVEQKTAVTHCPCSNMKLSSGAAKVAHYRDAGMTVALGTDGEKENNNLDMIEELKFGALLAKLSTTDPAAGDPWDLLEMATREGAKALGLDDVTGTIEVGKEADLVAVDLRAIHFVPLFRESDGAPAGDRNAVAHLVFSASGRDVSDVWVRGKRLVEDGVVTSVDIETVAQNAQYAAEELFERRRALGDPVAGPAAQLGKTT